MMRSVFQPSLCTSSWHCFTKRAFGPQTCLTENAVFDPTSPAKFCDECGAPYLRETSKFCSECGGKRFGT
ncbi:Uncharacterized protein CK203_015906 [Vitis vinifera]|uniref:Zinc-ribbon domain-containing protein n=1 Tax=Vitis vinifera TaxID=29760 RepID=A0A438JRM8_VITVI|nr:Uncharacterized protein CK203_015906 [Vitis vinifera]